MKIWGEIRGCAVALVILGLCASGCNIIGGKGQSKQQAQNDPVTIEQAAPSNKAEAVAHSTGGNGTSDDGKLAVDVTEQVKKYNSDAYAEPPDNFHSGKVKPCKLPPNALRRFPGGYVIQLPSKAPIPTPAVYQGKVYLSGGFKSRQFYCLHADSGDLKWGYDLDDDGPSSAAVADGVVVYNTESCTIFAHDAQTGNLLWSHWLGDPLMSSPTIANGRVFAGYPAAGRVAGSSPIGIGTFGDQNLQLQQNQKALKAGALSKPSSKPAPPMSHVLACFDLKTGKIIWQRWIDSDVMSAPVASGQDLHVASFAGTLYKFNQSDGEILSAKKQRATSAPIVVNNQLLFSKRTEAKGLPAQEAIVSETRIGLQKIFEQRMAYNLEPAVQETALLKVDASFLDAANGFSGGAPLAANAPAALYNIGQSNVSTLQAYQGARVMHWGGLNFSCPGGDKLVCTHFESGKKLWEIELEGDLQKEGGALAAPPSIAGGYLFLSTLKGEVLKVDPKKGKILKRYKIGSPTRFQPVIWKGSIFATTQNGKLVCFRTGDPKLTGWTQWGGNAARVGVGDELAKE